MNNFQLEVNERVEVIVNGKSYKSLVMDIDDEHIKINVPVNDGKYLAKQIGEELNINIYCKCGRCYSFNSKITGKSKEGLVTYYDLSSPYNIKRIQRRNFFRVDVISDAKYKNITGAKDESEIEKLPFNTATLIDLSGGGMRLRLKGQVQKHDNLLVKLEVENLKMIIKGEVIRIETNENLDKICGVKFLDMNEMQIDKIIMQLFEIMRKQKALQ